MTGGTVVVNGPTGAGNGALDVNGTFDVSGGTLLAAGSAGMVVSPDTTSAQGWVAAVLDSTVSAGETVEVVSADGTAAATFTAGKALQSVVYSSPDITSGEQYTVTVAGSEATTVTAGEAAAGTGGMGGGPMGGGGPGGGRPSDVPLAVTGATGRLGGRIARRLADAGVRQRLVVRDAARAPQLPGSTLAVASYDDGTAVRKALSGVSTVLMVSGAEHPDRLGQHRTFVDAAADAGVEHLVYVSFLGAAPDATFTLARDHWATEEHIRARGLRATFLRNSLYADFFPFLVGEDGVIRGPAGDGRVAAVAQDDIADAAVAVLREPAAHAGGTYDLTGPEALTLTEVAETVTAVTGRPVRYHPETVEEAYVSRAGYGAPDWQVDAWVSTYTAIAAGEMATVSSAVADLTGHPARTLAQLLRAG
jgi:NAD(P)H dehydrogenase (quinone)